MKPTVVAALVAGAFSLLTTGELSAQPHSGSPDLEPGIANRDDIILFEDFEYSNWQDHFSGVGQEQNLGIVTTPVFQGTSALRVRAGTGEHYGTSIEYDFADKGLAEPEEIYFRYYVYIDSSWNFTNSDGEIGKFPGFGGTYGVAGWGGNPSDGTNGWSARMMNFDDGATHAVGFYTYHADMPGTYGTHMRWDPALNRDEWICIEAYVKVNSITNGAGNNDGILRGWIGDAQVFERTDLRFRDVDNLKVQRVWFNIYVGGSWTADHDMELYFDNLVVAENPIGCYSDGGGGAGGSSASSSSGTGGSTSSGTGGASSSGTGGSGAAPPAATTDSSDDSGCGCRLTGAPRNPWGGGIVGVALLALAQRRRRASPAA